MAIDIVSEKLYSDKLKYDLYLEESKRIATKLLSDVIQSETKIEKLSKRLVLVQKKIKSQNKIVDIHLYSRRLCKIFTRYTWLKRDINYSTILEKNLIKIDIFNSKINIDNIDDPRIYQELKELYTIKELITLQKRKEKSFFIHR
jgi:hypothetical protein